MTQLSRRVTLLAGLGGALSGCGFHPVYAPASGDNPGAAAGLAEVDVKPIYERAGQVLREALLGRFGSESGVPSRFDLNVTFWITGEALGILNFTQPTRIRLVGNATWVLAGHDPKQTRLAEGSERLVDGFDVFDSQYFALDLENEAVQKRIAQAMAERITLRVAMWFRQHPTAVG